MVAAGLGVTLLPKLAVESGAIEGLGLVTRPLQEEEAGRQIALAWRASSPRGEEFRRLAGFIAGIAAAPRE
jgi:LysR family hydrogen peroxide-inducible transcriptional activator